MATPFLSILSPPGPIIHHHPLSISIPVPASMPPTFTGALFVRIHVFVEEQNCRLATEIDDDDERSWHWVAFASINGPRARLPFDPPSPARRPTEGRNVPVSTVRLVPPPHAFHPAPGSIDGQGGLSADQIVRVPRGDRATTFHDGTEPYVKLGRLATMLPYRGLRLANLVVRTALEWATHHRREIVGGPSDPIERERARVESRREGGEWRGLVLTHSQVTAIGFWEKMGFVRDEELGSWFEESIEHVAMWKRLELRN